MDFRGSLAPTLVADLERRASVVAIPSTAPEGLSLVALEAMARGAIVVATASGGLAETVRHGENGFVVAPGDSDALADALDNALSVAVEPSGDRIRAMAQETAAAHDLGASVAVSLDRYAEWVR